MQQQPLQGMYVTLPVAACVCTAVYYSFYDYFIIILGRGECQHCGQEGEYGPPLHVFYD